MKLTKTLLTFILLSPTIAFPSSSTQERRPQPQAKASQVVPSSPNASLQQQLETQKMRLGEINAAINELERKSEEIAAQRSALQTERSSLVIAISRGEAEQEFRNSPGYLVIGIKDEITLTLLMHGHEKDFRLFGLYVPARHTEAVSFLKRELVAGKAYVRCEDPACNWGFLYANRESTSLNQRMVEEGIAAAQSGLSLEDRLKEPVEISPPSTPATTTIRTELPTPTAGTSTGPGSPKQSPGTEVHVKGYTRKDGTYVPPHTRSAPRRKP